MRRSLMSVLVVAMTVASGCSDATDAARADCTGLADRWVRLQQQILDTVDDPRVGPDALDRHALAMIEQARDATAVGCTADVAVGSALICARIDLLRPGGPQGAAVVDGLRSACRQR